MRKKAPRVFIAVFCFMIVFVASSLYADTSIGGPSEMNLCEQGTFTITVENPSGSAVSVCVTDVVVTLPGAGYAYVTGTSTTQGPGGCNSSADPGVSGQTLTYTMSSLCGGAVRLDPGQSLTVQFDLITDCNAVSGNVSVDVHYDDCAGGASQTESTTSTVRIKPGSVSITKDPSVVSASVGDDVTWTLTVKSTGLGTIKNVVVTDTLGTGLTYVSSSPAGSVSGQTVTWDSTSVPALASMAPGDTVSIDITARVTACTDLGDTADVKWGCDGGSVCYDTSTDGGTATASVQLVEEHPELDYTPPDIAFNDYCASSAHVSFTITNNGNGTAYDPQICVNIGDLTVSNVSSGATYTSSGTSGCFHLPDLDPGGSYTLSFDVGYTGWCNQSPARFLIWLPEYKDGCGNVFHPPVKTSQLTASGTAPQLNVTKSGPSEIEIGSAVDYHIAVTYTGPTSCGNGGTTGPVTVTDHVPDGFTVTDAGGGTWTPGAGGTGGTIEWSFDPAVNSSFSTDITLQAPAIDQCQYCFTTYTNTVEASVTDCCGCDRQGSASQTTAIECSQYLTSDKTANPTSVETCGEITYTNTYVFGNDAALNGVDLSGMSFEDRADNYQQFVPGTLQVTFDGADITSCVHVNDGTPGGSLLLDFSGCSGAVQGKTLVITYHLRLTDQSQPSPPCGDPYTFYAWSTLDLGITGGNCLQDGKLHETTQITVTPPSMEIDLQGLPPIVEKCGTYQMDIVIDRTSAQGVPHDVLVRLNTDAYYVISVVGYDGITPSGPVDHGTYVEWDYGDGFASTSQATIHLTVQKKCEGGGDLTATVVFDDACHDDTQSDASCSASHTYSPRLLIGADLIISKTPEVYSASENKAQWTVYVVNKGYGTAYNVWIDDVLGSGLTYASSTVPSGVTTTPNQDHSGNTINGVSWTLDQLDPGKRVALVIDANLVSCSNLTNDVATSWGCHGDDCESPVTDDSTVVIPEPNLVATTSTTTPVDMCSEPVGTITLRDAGPTHLYHVVTEEVLPAGLTYEANTARWRKNGGAWSSAEPVAPNLTWDENAIPALADMAPDDVIEIEFTMVTDCTFNGGALTNTTRFQDPCGGSHTGSSANFTVNARTPDISVRKTRTSPTPGEAVDCGANLTWDITVTNNSNFTVPVVWVEDTLEDGLTYVSSSGGNDSYHGYGGNAQLVTWEIVNLGAGASVTLTLSADSAGTGDPNCNDIDNVVEAYWGCGSVDGSAQTKPGTDEPNTCLTTTAVQDTSPSTRDAHVTASVSVSPTSVDTCDSDATFTVTIDNPSATASVSNLDAVITLPNGLTYRTGTTSVSGCSSGPGSGDPGVSGQVLTYYDPNNPANDLCDSLDPGGSITLVFGVHSDCFSGGDMRIEVSYDDCCGITRHTTVITQRIDSSGTPVIRVTKTPRSSQVDCGDTQTWTITVENAASSGTAEIVRVEDTLGDWIAYVSSSPAATNLGGDPQRWGWEIADLNAGDTRTFEITGRLTPANYPNQNTCGSFHRENRARAAWGCGTPDGNPNTLEGCQSPIWVNAEPAYLRLPDLTVTDLTPGVTCTSDGHFSSSLTATIHNGGDGASLTNFTVSVTDGTWTGTGTYTGTINAGDTVTVSIDTSGWNLGCHNCNPYTLTATVDPGDAICECNETNNTYTETYAFDLPDLTVTDIDFTHITCTNDTLGGFVRVTVNNQGCGDVTNVTVSLGTDGCLSFGNQTGVNVPAGGSATVDFPVTANWADCTDCTCDFTATVDPGDAICECDGTNNTYTEIHAFDLPDLVVRGESLVPECLSDGKLRIHGTVTLENNGCVTLTQNVPVQFTLFDGTGCLIGSNIATWVETFTGVSIAPGGTQTFQVDHVEDINLCTALAGTEISIRIEADYSHVVCECDGTNNTLCTDKSIRTVNLAMLNVIPSIHCDSDGTVLGAVHVQVGNLGHSDISTDFEIALSDSDGNRLIKTFTELGGILPLRSNQTQTITFSNWRGDCVPCSITFTAEADPNHTFCECDSTDNSYTTVPYTIPVPDLAIVSVIPHPACNNTSVDVTVKNVGCVPVAGGAVVRITGSLSATTQTTTSLNPGASETLTLPLGDLRPGRYSMTATVDPDDVTCECDGINNAMNFSMEITQPACSIVVPNNIFGGTPVTLRADVRGGVPPYRFTWSDDCGGVFDSASSSSPVWTPPSGAGNRTCTLNLSVTDGVGCVTSCLLPVSVRPQIPPQPGTVLAIDKRVETRTIRPGGIARFSIEIKNTGDSDLTDVRLLDTQPEYFGYVAGSSALDGSSMPDPQVSGRALTWSLGTLGAGETRTLTYQAIAASDAGPGRHCNSVRASGTVAGTTPVTSNESTACVIIARGGMSGGSCCLAVSEEATGVTTLPDGYYSLVDPYYVTEDAMFASYAALHLWRSGRYPDRRMAQRLRDFALVNIRELYLMAGKNFGLTMPGGELWFPLAGGYTTRGKNGWRLTERDTLIKPSQVGMELLALDASLSEVDKDERPRLEEIIGKKLRWINREVAKTEDLPDSWKIEESREKGREIRIVASKTPAGRYQKAVLYFAAVTLSGRFAEARRLARYLESRLDVGSFDAASPEAEIFLAMALKRAGKTGKAKEKLDLLASRYRDGKVKFDTVEVASLAYFRFDTSRATERKRILKALEDAYIPGAGVITSWVEGTAKKEIRLRDIAGMMLASERGGDFLFRAVCKGLNETGLFYRTRYSGNADYLLVAPLNYLSLPNRYPLIPVFSTGESIPNVFLRKAVLIPNTGNETTAGVKSEWEFSAALTKLGESGKDEEMSEPFFPTKIDPAVLSGYQTKTASILWDAAGLTTLGRDLVKGKGFYAETGRQMIFSASSYLLSLMKVGPGYIHGGDLLLPADEIAVKGQIRQGERLESLRERASYSVDVMAAYLLAQKLVFGRIRNLPFYTALLKHFKGLGYIPERFYVLPGKGEPTVVGETGHAGKMAAAKLYLVFRDTFTKRLLEKGGKEPLKPEDVYFLKRFPELVPYFKADLEDYLQRGANREGLDWEAARVMAAGLVGRDPDLFRKQMEKYLHQKINFPVGRVESFKEGNLNRSALSDLILYLSVLEGENGFRRGVDILDDLLVMSWELRHDGDKERSLLRFPPEEVWIVREGKKYQADPGDLLTMEVTLENLCPLARSRAMDLPQVMLRATFDPNLIYVGTRGIAGLRVLKDFFWKYTSLYEGALVRYDYQARIPGQFDRTSLTGEIKAEGYTGYSRAFPDQVYGQRCEDSSDFRKTFTLVRPEEIPVAVYLDENGNGKRDPGEAGIPNIMIRDSRARIYRTDRDGIAKIPVGAHLVLASLYLQGVDKKLYSTSPLVVVLSRKRQAPSFGLALASRVTGVVFVDGNGNGRLDPGEETAAGVVVQTHGMAKMTDDQGRFEFRLIPEAWVKEIALAKGQPIHREDVTRFRIWLRVSR